MADATRVILEILNDHEVVCADVIASQIISELEREGFALVPVKPTQAMRDAYFKAHAEWENPKCVMGPPAPDHQWQAMLRASQGESDE